MIAPRHHVGFRRGRGFTLVEILVVVLIIGLGIGIVALNIGGNRPLALRTDARQLADQIGMVASDAALGNEPWGLQFYRDTDAASGDSYIAWRWLHFRTPEVVSIADTAADGDSKKGDSDDSEANNRPKATLGWQPEAPRELDAGGHFAADVSAVLTLDGQEVPIELLAQSGNSGSTKTGSENDSQSDKSGQTPDIWLLPGGEMTPFVLHLRYADNGDADRDAGVTIRGDALGRIDLDTPAPQ